MMMMNFPGVHVVCTECRGTRGTLVTNLMQVENKYY